ncbi:MAG: helix-turn-helix domain-containing protein [Pyrinomonadaceae bacterium]
MLGKLIYEAATLTVTLDRLCAAFKCEPNDILKYEPDNSE